MPSSPDDFVSTDIPARLDRLPWSRRHTLVVIALGIAWLLDGLEGNLAGALAGILKLPATLGFTDADLGLTSTIYLFGAVTDRVGRKRLFSLTLLLYLSATAATAFSWNRAGFSFFRALTGAGILKPGFFPVDIGWRFAFFIGAAIGLGVLFMRRHVPESPRWVLIHRSREEAEKIVEEIESKVTDSHPGPLPPPEGTIRLRIGNLFGSILVGRLFDTVGRRKMIALTYTLSGVLLASVFFLRDMRTIVTQTIAWTVVFFVASSAASSAHLTASEVFPLEIRAIAIAIFYACGTFVGGPKPF